MIKQDIIILGAGPAGIASALFLAKKGIPSTIIEKEEFPRDKVCGDCLGGYAISILHQIDKDLFGRFINYEQKLVGQGVHFFGPDKQKVSIEAINTVGTNMKEVALCKRIDFDDFLYKEAERHKAIQIVQNTFISKLHFQNEQVHLYDKKGSEIGISKMIIIASGSNHNLVNQVRETKLSRKNFASGVRAYYDGIEGLDRKGFIELHFLKKIAPGYLWIFPLNNNQANVGLGIRSDIIAKEKINLRQLLDSCIEDNEYLRDRFKNARQLNSVKGFPLALGGKRYPISGDRYLLAGDAANLIEPLFGEGIGHAMYSGKFAAEHACNCLQKNDFSAQKNKDYDRLVYEKLGSTLRFSSMMQKIAFYPKIMGLLFDRITTNKQLQRLMFGIINGKIPKTRVKGLEVLLRFIFNF